MEKTELMKWYEAEMNWSLEQAKKDYKVGIFIHAYIEWLENQLRWRPVSNPPKENVSVEVCDLSKSSLDEREPEIGYYENGEWFCIFPYDLNIYKKITPTHWRYIPPAPEGEVK